MEGQTQGWMDKRTDAHMDVCSLSPPGHWQTSDPGAEPSCLAAPASSRQPGDHPAAQGAVGACASCPHREKGAEQVWPHPAAGSRTQMPHHCPTHSQCCTPTQHPSVGSGCTSAPQTGRNWLVAMFNPFLSPFPLHSPVGASGTGSAACHPAGPRGG